MHGLAQQNFTQGFPQWGTAGLAGYQYIDAALAQGVSKPRQMRAFARPIYAFKSNKLSHAHFKFN